MIPKISVIVPAYNIEKYLQDCLDSILDQSYSNIEIIIVNDGSTDSTGSIADQYKAKYPDRIQVLHLENGGVTRARLSGIQLAAGEWIGFVDGDDVIEPDMYARLMKNAEDYNADISHCGYQTIVNDGERIHYFHNTGKIVPQAHREGLRDLLSGSFIEPGLWNKIYKRDLIKQALEENALDKGIKISEDLLMNYYFFKKASKAIFEDFCPYHYISRKSSATRSGFKLYRALDPCRVWKTIYKDLAEEELKKLVLGKYLASCINAYETLYQKKDFKSEAVKIKKELRNHKDQWSLLSKNARIKLYLLLYFPKFYLFIIRVYRKHFQKKIYE